MRPGSPHHRRPAAFAGAGAILGLLIYLLPLAAAMTRPGWGGAVDRTPGIVFARYRQAQLDVVTDDRPVPRPPAPALPSACMPAVLAPAPTSCSGGGDARNDLASRPPSAGTPRSPPVP